MLSAIRTADSCTESRARCAYRAVVCTCVCPRSFAIMGLLKNPSSDRGECRTMRQRPLGGWFGCWGPDGLLRVPFRRLGVPRWPTGRHEGRRQAA